MRFVPVPGTKVLFCIHETRYKDYAAYAADSHGMDGSWKDQSADSFTPAGDKEDHPVMKVGWEDAQAFCAWLSKKEGKAYRLPTDQEWSLAAGIGDDEKWMKDTTPATVFKNHTEFPWGSNWPPPSGSGNYSDQNRKEKAPIANARYLDSYDDGFPTIAPVMGFKPNKLGLYDLGGNVWEWCEDFYDNAKKNRVLRGGSWHNSARADLLSSYRGHDLPGIRGNIYGFRLVLSGSAPVTVVPSSASLPPPTAATTAKSGFTNTLGMKFVRVTGTDVLFCIHETRRQDYAVYAAEDTGADGSWKDMRRRGIPCGHEDNHPVVGVNWLEAQKFCAWLSKKEGKTYRLPTDQEWSHAVDIGRDEKWTKDTTPESLHQQVQNEFPWGRGFPPKSGDQAGNYGDTAWKQRFPTDNFSQMARYRSASIFACPTREKPS